MSLSLINAKVIVVVWGEALLWWRKKLCPPLTPPHNCGHFFWICCLSNFRNSQQDSLVTFSFGGLNSYYTTPLVSMNTVAMTFVVDLFLKALMGHCWEPFSNHCLLSFLSSNLNTLTQLSLLLMILLMKSVSSLRLSKLRWHMCFLAFSSSSVRRHGTNLGASFDRLYSFFTKVWTVVLLMPKWELKSWIIAHQSC